tara:strand:- start:711 stop:1055 length:345 start_codon:yes stop_codon:yes gene_type:complete
MVDFGFTAIIIVFLIYYFAVLILERKIIQDPKHILDKFLSTVLLYAGISLIYFSITGEAFLRDNIETYNVYIFVIGFISVLWTVPNLLQEFTFFQNFINKSSKKRLKSKKGIIA